MLQNILYHMKPLWKVYTYRMKVSLRHSNKYLSLLGQRLHKTITDTDLSIKLLLELHQI